MSANNYQVLSTFTLAPSGTQILDMDLRDIGPDLQIMISVTYAAGTSSLTGVTWNMKSGMGDNDVTLAPFWFKLGGSNVPVYDSIGENKVLNTVTPSQGSTSTTNTELNVFTHQISRWLRNTFTNSDPGKTCSISIYADL